MTNTNPARYRRILVKLSGEALLGSEDYGIDPNILKRIAGEIRDLTQMGVQVAVVLGGGNIFRGAGLARAGMDRVTGDHMGMLATVINALAMQDALEQLGIYARVMSALRINDVCEDYIRRRAVRHLVLELVVEFDGESHQRLGEKRGQGEHVGHRGHDQACSSLVQQRPQ